MERGHYAVADVTRLFVADAILPVQVVRPPADCWLQRLCLAILEDALKCLEARAVRGARVVARARSVRIAQRTGAWLRLQRKSETEGGGESWQLLLNERPREAAGGGRGVAVVRVPSATQVAGATPRLGCGRQAANLTGGSVVGPRIARARAWAGAPNRRRR